VQNKDREQVLVVFLAVVNHWVALVAHKPDPENLSVKKTQKQESGINLTKVYYLDSSNFQHLHKENTLVPEVVMDRVRDKIRCGLKVTEKFAIEMTI
jgi:cephalosporin-C deacetylase-like acetyl esterase